MAYRYIVDYTKAVIKSKQASGYNKFMALLFLKEVTKTNDPRLVNYLDTKILARFFALASSKEGKNCLTVYDKKVNLEDSANFHYLLRECFTNWGSQYKLINKNYISYTKKLSAKKLVPAPEEKYWNYPYGIANNEPLRGDSIINDFPEGGSQNNSNMNLSEMSRSRSPSPNVQPTNTIDSQVGLIIRFALQ